MSKNAMDIKRETACDMLYISGCVLKGKTPDPVRVKEMDIEKLYKMSRFHSMTAMVYEGLQAVFGKDAPEIDQELWLKFRNAKENAVRKTLLFDTERAKLFAFMEEKGIWYLPLKGVILKNMYPKLGLRQMADNDILYDAAYQTEVRSWFEAQGYEVISFGEYNHDVYQKKPVYNFEMHTALYGEWHKEGWQPYYQDVKKRLVKDQENNFGYHFSDEDFYIYILTHGYKHYHSHGNGFRFLIDLYVFLEKKQHTMDWKYIRTQLDILGVSEFENKCCRLVENLFHDAEYLSEDKITLENRKFFSQFLSSGTYGSQEVWVEKNLNQFGEGGDAKTVVKYYINRLFPKQEMMIKRYPRIAKYRCLLPIAWILRIMQMLFQSRKRIQKEFREILHSREQQKERMRWEENTKQVDK